ncbi:winged helix-turn-helix domain-containing protein [Solwaraspora sp. WMMA2065]|uniref:AfsR/SARP family transcriptional regulator n=1 Tax=Solwaraspora sp. WMMA2065 TaxID=3015166 RepID=UPI00338D4940
MGTSITVRHRAVAQRSRGGVFLRVQVLGPVRVWREQQALDPGPTARRAVLGLLALAGGHPLPRSELADALWPDQPPPVTSTNVIQTHVKHLRRLFEPDRPAGSPETPSSASSQDTPLPPQTPARRSRRNTSPRTHCGAGRGGMPQSSVRRLLSSRLFEVRRG